MCFPAITRLHSMRKVVANMLVSIRLPILSLDCNGRVFTLYFACYLLAGRRVLFFITIWSRQYLAQCSYGVPMSKYIDDRHVRQLLVQSPGQPWAPSVQNAEAAAYILCNLPRLSHSSVSSVILSGKHSCCQKERNSNLRCSERTFWNLRLWH